MITQFTRKDIFNDYQIQINKEVMKKNIILIVVFSILMVAPSFGQHFRDSKYYNPQTVRLDYSSKQYNSAYGPWNYFGIRLGPSISSVSSDDAFLDDSSSQTGLNITAVAGFALSDNTPIYLETGLIYAEKGGKTRSGREKITFSLNYLEVPLVVKYCYNIDSDFSIQPFAGGYLACGVGGRIKDYGARKTYSSFGKDTPEYPRFDRFDGGLRLGCGVGYDVFYADLCVDLGLANISNDIFDKTQNFAFSVNIGVNF